MQVPSVSDDEIWVDVEASAADAVFRHLNMYKIGREVSVEKSGRKILSLVGPASLEVLGTSPGDEYRSTPATIAGAECLVVATDLGLDVICGEGDAAAVRAELESRKAVPVSASAVEILRVESGRPRFGAEMNEKNMPAEAGIVEQAVSFTKGCYIGQEPVARLHYEGKPESAPARPQVRRSGEHRRPGPARRSRTGQRRHRRPLPRDRFDRHRHPA